MAANGKITIGVKIEEGKDGFKNITADATELKKVLEATQTQAAKLNEKFVNTASTITTLTGIQSAVSQLSSFLGELTQESNEFSAAMKAANTMAGKDAAGFEDLKSQVTELSKSIPVARDELANGLYQVISNGVPEDNWIEFLNMSARSAVGGIADLGQVVGVTSTVIKNYGLSWSEAQTIQDKIQLTAKNGVTSFEQLASALPRVTGNAATLGVSIDELMATFATLTGVSGNTAEVSTQLAAIFTALVKPSSEAAKMAAEMGLQFDAAAIKAAGGFQAFLQSLDQSVKEYSKASGVLEQEVYGKLFGSAESLRALVPLQGELASKFSANVAEMSNSAGVMDEAFGNMSSTGAAVSQMLENQTASFRDMIASVASTTQPYLNYIASLGMSLTSIKMLVEAWKGLDVAHKTAAASQALVTAAKKSAAAVNTLLSTQLKVLRTDTLAFAMASDVATKSMIAARIALRGLLMASGVGLVIWGLTEALGAFIGSSDKAADASDRLSDSLKEQKNRAEAVREANTAGMEAYTSTRSALILNIAKLKEFNGSKEEEARLVSEMNSVYGDSMGYFQTVAAWYDALIKNSEAYCAQMVIEARTRKYADKIAELEAQRDEILYKEDGSKKKYSSKRQTREVYDSDGEVVTYGLGGAPLRGGAAKTHLEEEAGTSDLEKASEKYNALGTSIEFYTGKLKNLAAAQKNIKMPVLGTPTAPENPVVTPTAPTKEEKKKGEKSAVKTSDKEIAPEGSLENLRQQVTDIDKKIHFSVDPDEIYKLRRQRAELEQKIEAIEIPLKLAESKEEMEKITEELPELTIKVNPDMGKLPKEIKGIDDGTTSAKKLELTMQSVTSTASTVGQAFSGLGQAFEVPALDFLGILAGAIATMVQGFATATSQAAALGPFAWLGFAATGLATLTTMITSVKNVAKFADGGIVSGPTMALVGEYAGAHNNPEVIAPLNKLRDLIGGSPSQTVVVGGTLRASGRTIEVALANETRIGSKSGRRSKIKI